jgi:two-component system, cell cycle sensor histidine kinase and response regulator CckA
MPGHEELERRLALLELTTDLVGSATPDGRVTYLNQSGFALLGWDPSGGVAGKTIPDFHPRWATELVLNTGLPTAMRAGVWEAETALLTASGAEIPVSQVLVAHRDATGKAVHLSTIMRDIRERKRIEEQLRASTQMFQLIMDYIPQFVFWKDRNSVYQGCNRNFAVVAGVGSVENIVGKADYELAWKREEAEFFRKVDREVMDADEPLTHIIEPQLQADGKHAWLDTSKIPLHDEHGEVVGILGMFEDITDRKLAEEQLRQNQKLESIGQLAGGIAHDFNNMLTAIIGAAELLTMRLDADAGDGLRRLAEEILDAADKAAGLTQRLLEFSRKGSHSREPVDVHTLLEAAAGLLARTVDRRIEVVIDLRADLVRLLGDPSQLQSMLLNLGVNARDAMANSGRLRLATANVQLEPGDPRAGAFAITPGPYVEIEVSDTGGGMSPSVAKRVFEPFFTTKPVGQGTGLGLSAVYSAVVDHGGAITFETKPGVGTSFRVYLPVDPDAEPVRSRTTSEQLRGRARILLVDDEELVRNVAAAMLTSLGYEVVMAADGEEAVGVYAREGETIDLVILDMIMPKLNGRETLQRLRELDPDVAVLFCSGYTRERVEVEDEGVRGFLKKPYQLAELARHIADALAQGQ